MSTTPEISPLTWAHNIRTFAAEGRLRQHVWNKDEDEGRHIACLLGTISNDVTSVDAVPCAAVCMPTWLASMIPGMFDSIRRDKVQDFALRFADAVEGWCVLTPRAWRRIELRARAWAIRKAVLFAGTRQQEAPKPYWPPIQTVCTAMADLLEEQAGEVHGPGEAAHATDAAYAARAAALAADAAYAARAAALAADAADAAYAARAAALAADAADAAALAADAAALAADAARAADAALAALAADAAALAADAARAADAADAAARAARAAAARAARGAALAALAAALAADAAALAADAAALAADAAALAADAAALAADADFWEAQFDVLIALIADEIAAV